MWQGLLLRNMVTISIISYRSICTAFNQLYIGVHFPTEIEVDEPATASPVVESGVSVEHCDLIGVVMCVSCTTVGCRAEDQTQEY